MAKKRVEEKGVYVLRFPGKDEYWVECTPSELWNKAVHAARELGFTTVRGNVKPVPCIVEKTQIVNGMVSRYEVEHIDCDVPLAPLNDETYTAEMAALLIPLPYEFGQFIRQQAWDRGHSAGYEECLNIARDLFHDLTDVLGEYHNRMHREGIFTK